jgi:pimeloyl-ACP methyl ester carboxylesterase
LLTGVTAGVFTDFAGDAARYLDANPKNVSRRYDIVRGGVAMLRKLHTDCDEEAGFVMYRYGRVVLLGHSLGSVIAYDILRHYWQEVNGKIDIDPTEFHRVENFSGGNDEPKFAGAAPYSDAELFRTGQRAAWCHLSRDRPAGVKLKNDRKSDARWLVTDLVTLGSPLTYAPLLLADGLDDFESKRRLRELPICPPIVAGT